MNPKIRKERIAVAKDALAWIKAGALEVSPGSFIRTPIGFNPYSAANDHGNKEAREVVIGKCRACALGALFIANVVRNDRCTVAQLSRAHETFIKNHLSSLFEDDELDVIEQAFEMTVYRWHESGPHEEALTFAERHDLDDYEADAKARLELILKNIIKNNGVFCP